MFNSFYKILKIISKLKNKHQRVCAHFQKSTGDFDLQTTGMYLILKIM